MGCPRKLESDFVEFAERKVRSGAGRTTVADALVTGGSVVRLGGAWCVQAVIDASSTGRRLLGAGIRGMI